MWSIYFSFKFGDFKNKNEIIVMEYSLSIFIFCVLKKIALKKMVIILNDHMWLY
jgi:hypothetical protein